MILAIFESIFSKIELVNLTLHFFTFSFHKLYKLLKNRLKAH
ncbi:hypothetical protein CSG_7450 [Campylobacter fetus subsp. venerealis str. 84-112]|nr:hypothetical protein CSG_7450 [Campylobacter fetus subsp. venerealis str. 84-112]